MKLSLLKRYIIIISICFIPVVSYATIIDNLSSWRGSGIGNFGEDNSGPNTDSAVYATYGQTFKLHATDDKILQSIRFYVDDNNYYNTIDFAIYLYAWDGVKISGDALFESPVLQTTQISGYEEIKVDTGGIFLDYDTDYVAFMSASNFFDGIIGFGKIGWAGNSYLDGKLVYMNNKDDFNRLSVNSWGSFRGGNDLAFKLELTPAVPEPSTLLLVLFSFCLIFVFKRRVIALV